MNGFVSGEANSLQDVWCMTKLLLSEPFTVSSMLYHILLYDKYIAMFDLVYMASCFLSSVCYLLGYIDNEEFSSYGMHRK